MLITLTGLSGFKADAKKSGGRCGSVREDLAGENGGAWGSWQRSVGCYDQNMLCKQRINKKKTCTERMGWMWPLSLYLFSPLPRHSLSPQSFSDPARWHEEMDRGEWHGHRDNTGIGSLVLDEDLSVTECTLWCQYHNSHYKNQASS